MQNLTSEEIAHIVSRELFSMYPSKQCIMCRPWLDVILCNSWVSENLKTQIEPGFSIFEPFRFIGIENFLDNVLLNLIPALEQIFSKNNLTPYKKFQCEMMKTIQDKFKERLPFCLQRWKELQRHLWNSHITTSVYIPDSWKRAACCTIVQELLFHLIDQESNNLQEHIRLFLLQFSNEVQEI
jgi:hypothetical protein